MLRKYSTVYRFFNRSLSSSKHFDSNLAYDNKITIYLTEKIAELIKTKLEKIKFSYYRKGGNMICFYPRSIANYNELCDILNYYSIIFYKNFINPDHKMFSRSIFCANFKIDGYEFRKNLKTGIMYYYDLTEEHVEENFFKNCPSNDIFSKNNFISYDRFKLLKISPNILKINHSYLLTLDNIKNIFKNQKINNIVPPLTEYGFWLIYVGDRQSYIDLLYNKFSIDDQNILIEPYYLISNAFPIYKKSKNGIQIYTWDKNLKNTNMLINALDIDNISILSQKLNSGVLHSIYTDDQSTFDKIVYRNGLKLNGTLDYTMIFTDEISQYNTSRMEIFFKLDEDNEEKIISFLFTNDYTFKIYDKVVLINPKTLDQFNFIRNGINVGNKYFYPYSYSINNIKVNQVMSIMKPSKNDNDSDIVKNIMKNTPYNIVETNKDLINFRLNYTDYIKTIFSCDLSSNKFSCIQPTSLSFIDSKTKRFLDTSILKLDNIDVSDISNLKFPFEYKLVQNDGIYLPIIKIYFSTFLKNVYQKVLIGDRKVNLIPIYTKVKSQNTFLFGSENRIASFRDILSSLNISSRLDERKILIYPRFQNLHQYILFMKEYSNFNFSKSIMLNVGEEIFQL